MGTGPFSGVVVFVAPDIRGKRKEIFTAQLKKGGAVVADEMTNAEVTHVITSSSKVVAESDSVAMVSPVRVPGGWGGITLLLFSLFSLLFSSYFLNIFFFFLGGEASC